MTPLERLPNLPLCLIVIFLVGAAASIRAEDNPARPVDSGRNQKVDASQQSSCPGQSSKVSSTDWLKEETQRLIEGCKIENDSGVMFHTPDGIGHYKGMWIREYYFIARYAGEFVSDANMKATIPYILDRQRADGCIPNFVRFDGRPVYTVGGKAYAKHAVDNGSFMALAICEYVRRTGDYDFFRSFEPKLRRGLDHIQRAENGLVYVPPSEAIVGLGWTDIVRKTGHLLFTSLLYYQACVELDEVQQAMGGEPLFDYRASADLIRKNISILWDDQSGMFFAADRGCRQIDIWGSAYAVEIGIATEAQKERIADYVIAHWDGIVRDGLMRHLPEGEVWQRFFPGRSDIRVPGVYMNGAYWSLPLPWVVPLVWSEDPERARQMVNDAIEDFRVNGVAECVNEDYSRKVPNYVTSVTNLYAASRWLSSQR